MTRDLHWATREVLTSRRAKREPDAAAARLLSTYVHGRAKWLYPGLDAEELAQAVLAGILTKKEIQSPTAYIEQAVHNKANDVFRQRGRRPEDLVAMLPERAASEDAIARMLDADAGHSEIVAGLKIAVAAGDTQVVQVVEAWLNLARATGKAPSSREVAPYTDFTHSTVLKILDRFRAMLAANRGK